MIEFHTALAQASAQMLSQAERLTHEESVEGMQGAKAAQVEVAEELLRDDVPAPEIQALLSHIDRDLYARLARLCLAEMGAAGRGEPPLPCCVIVMGSCGRGESYIYPDQDFGIILANYPEDQHDRIDPWYIELGSRMSDALAAIGLPYCKGGVMGHNPLWRKNVSQWRQQIDIWIRRRNNNFIRLADIFFDFRPVFGDFALAGELRDHVTRRFKGNHLFLQAMYWIDDDRKVALGLFNRFITERRVEAHRGEINLKFTGTLPLVEAVRILALREGIAETSTLARMAALHGASVLGDDEHDDLRGAYAHITRLMLRQQIADFKAGRKVSNYIPPATLSKREKDLLVDAFKAIRTLLDQAKYEIEGELFRSRRCIARTG